MKQRFFGTDGIRGVVGNFPIVADFARDLAEAVDAFMLRRGMQRDRAVLIAMDTRESGVAL
ncbi:MAG TPA: phosphoglucosamine mutase, partial [Opitutales bacterium]|nr:phosphoglucosamine mutase [Opitutales bacterium]